MLFNEFCCKHIIVGFYLIVQFSCSFAQQTFSDKYEAAVDKLTNQNRINEQILYNGISYADYLGKLDGNAYWADEDKFLKANLFYDGFVFYNVPIKYDVSQDKMISLLSDRVTKFSLVASKIGWVFVNNCVFVYLPPEISHKMGYEKGGIFERLYDRGKIKIYAKWTKEIKEVLDVTGLTKKFFANSQFYVVSEGQIDKIQNKAKLLQLMGGQKGSVRKYMKDNRLNFKTDPRGTIVALSSFFDILGK